LSVRTIDRAYRGGRIEVTTRERIRQTAEELGLPPPPPEAEPEPSLRAPEPEVEVA
jgi:DNA-binding LacI/PurR family transcriptional regulator